MRITSTIVGALCLLVGCIWFLQGINVLPGSFMTGQIRWNTRINATNPGTVTEHL